MTQLDNDVHLGLLTFESDILLLAMSSLNGNNYFSHCSSRPSGLV